MQEIPGTDRGSDQQEYPRQRAGLQIFRAALMDALAPCLANEAVISLPMPPSTNMLFFNGRPGQGRIRTPEYNAWIKEAGWQLAAQRPRQLTGRVSILIEVSDAESSDNWDLASREKATVDLPRHPLMTGYDTPMTEWTVPWFANRQAKLAGAVQ
jgi:hypothetical protein